MTHYKNNYIFKNKNKHGQKLYKKIFIYSKTFINIEQKPNSTIFKKIFLLF